MSLESHPISDWEGFYNYVKEKLEGWILLKSGEIPHDAQTMFINLRCHWKYSEYKAAEG